MPLQPAGEGDAVADAGKTGAAATETSSATAETHVGKAGAAETPAIAGDDAFFRKAG